MAEAPGIHPIDPVRPTELTIDCDECRYQGTATCADCVVTFLCDRAPEDAVVIDVTEVRAVRLLSAAGLVPALRHRPTG